ncbi:hypothetical protein PTQ33_01555 [Campylobacter sp. 50012-21]|uniref:hypothetical protein n=1 Tax=Campylobacter magnus TaxID=3026462 RepID=UPI00235E6B58|nr:hypothetical protein [Campylobacter magnus]MDD0845810.1 hypothetical protein [Campylobacter magnus]
MTGSAFWLFFTFIAWAAQHLMQKLLHSFCSAHALCYAPPKLYAKLLQTLRYGAPRLACAMKVKNSSPSWCEATSGCEAKKSWSLVLKVSS